MFSIFLDSRFPDFQIQGCPLRWLRTTRLVRSKEVVASGSSSLTSVSAGGGAGGIWKSGNLEIWEFGDLGTWKSRNFEIWGPGNSKLWDPKNGGKNIKNQIRSAQNVGKVWISRKKSSWPYLGPSEAIFPWTEKIMNMLKVCIFFLGGALAAIHPGWGNRYK